MTPKKVYYLLISLLVIVVLGIIGAAYFSNTFLKRSSNALVEAKLELYKIDETESTYRKNKLLLEQNQDIATILSSIVPSEKDQARAVREISRIASEKGLSVRSIRFPSSDLVAKNTKTTTNANGTTPSPTAGPTVSQAKPVNGLTGVLGMNVELEIANANPANAISTDQMLGFLEEIENNRRNIRVTSVSYGPAIEEGKIINMDTILFIKP